MLFQQRDPSHGHAPVHGFAHVVNGQQGHLHGREGFKKIKNLQHTEFNRLTLSYVLIRTNFGQKFLPTFSVLHTLNVSMPRPLQILGQICLSADPTVPPHHKF
jgi:hypothetical protein